MTNELTIRESGQGDWNEIEALYPMAFPEEDLVPLLRDLLRAPEVVTSLVATIGPEIVGHGAFTSCGVGETEYAVALLGPLAVSPEQQRSGVGTALVREGLRRMRDLGMKLVLVLGDPAYYGRFGFAPEAGIAPPFPLPAEWEGAWRSVATSEVESMPSGKLSVPGPWLEPALWLP